MDTLWSNSPSLSFNWPRDLWFLFPGVVRVSLADMDRETRENYTILIQAKDMGGQLGGLAGTTTVNITLSDVNDNPPVFDQRKQNPECVYDASSPPWHTLLPLLEFLTAHLL